MTTKKLSFHLAQILHEHGYDVYSDEQYIINENNLNKSHLSLDECALVELTTKKKFIYVPTLNEAKDWFEKNYPDWNIAVLWDNKMNGYHFTVQNHKTGYDYVQPTAPNEMNKDMMYEWGMEHALNRIE